MATLYKEIQEMVKKIAQWRKMTYVVKVSNQPITGADPNSVMAAISATLVYADTRNDITNDVIFNLNRFYKATASPAAAKPAATGPASAGQPPAANASPAGRKLKPFRLVVERVEDRSGSSSRPTTSDRLEGARSANGARQTMGSWMMLEAPDEPVARPRQGVP